MAITVIKPRRTIVLSQFVQQICITTVSEGDCKDKTTTSQAQTPCLSEHNAVHVTRAAWMALWLRRPIWMRKASGSNQP